MTKEEFKAIRQQLKLKGEALARRLGETVGDVLAWETGTKRIPEKVEKYLETFKQK